jgi:allene oxide cyclase
VNRLALVLPAALVALAVPLAADASPATLRLTERQTFQRVIDKGAKGESPGDIRTFGGLVFQAGKHVGHDEVQCVVGKTCNAQVWIRGGSLIARSFVVTGPTFTARITGGTGVYAGARGSVKVSSGPVARYTVTITG